MKAAGLGCRGTHGGGPGPLNTEGSGLCLCVQEPLGKSGSWRMSPGSKEGARPSGPGEGAVSPASAGRTPGLGDCRQPGHPAGITTPRKETTRTHTAGRTQRIRATSSKQKRDWAFVFGCCARPYL